MRFLILSLTLFSFNVSANYVAESKISSCGLKKIYSKIERCQKDSGEICHYIDRSYSCNYSMYGDRQVDDYSKPTGGTKNEIELCSDKDSCELIKAPKRCLDIREGIYISEDYSEVYCSRPTSWEKKTVKKFYIDAAKKSAHDSAVALKQSRKTQRRANYNELKAALDADQDLTQAQVKKLFKLVILRLKE